MHEADDRLAGDPVWELFPGLGSAPTISRNYRLWIVIGLMVGGWFVFPPVTVVTACLAVAAGDFRNGRRLALSIPDKAGGKVCARFRYAWGAWKVGMAAFVLMFVTISLFTAAGERRGVPPAFVAAMLLWMGGFTASAALTAAGMMAAYRSGMRVWVGQGVNQARTLLIGMLVVGFTVGVLGPMCLWLTGRFPRAGDSQPDAVGVLGFFGCMFGGPLAILLVLDWLSRRVVADRPGKFGPKVPTVGKWNG